MKKWATWLGLALCVVSLKALVGCDGDTGPRTGGLTNWLRVCDWDAECGPLSCVCGVCTRSCESESECADLDGASCTAPTDQGAVALCGGQEPQHGAICMAPCVMGRCDDGYSCVAGLCRPALSSTATLVVRGDDRAQQLVGIGAVLAYGAGGLMAHPQSSNLLDVMFVESGFDMLGLLNSYDGTSAPDLEALGRVMEEATERLDGPPVTHMTSGSPPADLKANGSRLCAGDPDVCTLRNEGGSFDYAALGDYFRSALEVYASVGVEPDYFSIQKNPNWVPSESNPNEACRFLPSEGTLDVDVDGSIVQVAYPGYGESLDAVYEAIADLDSPPALLGPETSGYTELESFAEAMDSSKIVALSHHVYGTDPWDVDGPALRALGDYAQNIGLPLFQTEMRAEGFETALLLHHVLAVEGAAVYLQHNFLTRPATDGENHLGVLVVTDESFSRHEIYHALHHYAAYTDPGWTRLELSLDSDEIFASAWVSPDERALTVVLTNPSETPFDVEVDPGDVFPGDVPQALVTRTVFDGIERSAELGDLPADHVVSLPSHSVVTVAFGS